MATDNDLEEGDLCPECKLGIMSYLKVENCSCHISPPCIQCMNNPLICNHCGYEVEYEN